MASREKKGMHGRMRIKQYKKGLSNGLREPGKGWSGSGQSGNIQGKMAFELSIAC